MSKKRTLPTFGQEVPGEGGRLAGIMRGPLVNGVYQADYALIVADMKAAKLPWGKHDHNVPSANSLTDGFANTEAMALAQCPAALHVRKLEIGGHKDWYLAARAEMWAARANVPELFEKVWHWTSTQDSPYGAFIQDFEYGGSGAGSKVNEYRARAFRRIPLQHFPA